jgi:peptidoglycan/LPS O-acetylase OafA/YrhL
VAAELYVTKKFPHSRVVVLPALVIAIGLNFTLEVGWPLREFLSGIMFFLIVSLVAQGGRAGELASWRPLVTVGTFSYSLYLLHGPILIGAERLAQRLPVDPSTASLGVSLALVPAILLASWGLYLVAERPFLSSTSRQRLRGWGAAQPTRLARRLSQPRAAVHGWWLKLATARARS